MRYPLISLSRHACRVLLLDGNEPGELERGLHGLVERCFANHEAALAYLRFWRGDASAMGDLRHALLHSGTLPAGPRGSGPDALLSAVAEQLQRGALRLYESHLHRTPPGRLALAPGSGASGMAALAALPSLDDLPSVPVLPPLLPALEDLQIEGAEVMPEVEQSLAQIDATLGTVGSVSASLEPAPDGVPAVKSGMADASARVKGRLDAL